MTLSITKLCHYAKCHYAECRNLFIGMLNAIKLGVVMLSVVVPKKAILNHRCLINSYNTFLNWSQAQPIIISKYKLNGKLSF